MKTNKKKIDMCSKCKTEALKSELIAIVKRIETDGKIITRLCEDCYYEMLGFIDAEDVEV